MAARIALAGGDDAFVGMLDRVLRVRRRAGDAARTATRSPTEMAAGYALNRFEGLNNEPDMEAPWAYHYAGRPDRTAEVVHAALTWQFGTGPGGLPGNDDSGGLSSWYVWASLGLFPVAGQNLFLVNAPAFARAALRVGGGRVRHRDQRAPRGPRSAPTASRRHRPSQYVQSATAQRSTAATTAHLSAADVHGGGVLHLQLGPEPSQWGRSARPPSLSDRAHRRWPTMRQPRRRLVIVVRADPVICGHSGEARNLAEVALTRGASPTSGCSPGRSRRCRRPGCR